MMTRKNLISLVCAGIVAAIPFIEGCVTSGKQKGSRTRYGSLDNSGIVDDYFRDFESDTNHKPKDDLVYYITGPKVNCPTAILALDKKYNLGSGFWRPLNSQDKTLRELVENMNGASDNRPYGADVLDHNGNDIGDWYSTTNSTIIKTKDGKTFQIYTPKTGTGGGGSDSSGGGSGGSGGGGDSGGGGP